ncbi:hypothetical protein CLV72_104269 [Allonocardiopsis opalescens]|uniref:Uncharacterized protein n=1 Tax=Allonocardiopsis opalescens TaxID=1144618 RepID=A0A2T0Q4H8_9ACTN|nr:hypothetical protein CLV72_104269 [Allonocardiopsis opalescens]
MRTVPWQRPGPPANHPARRTVAMVTTAPTHVSPTPADACGPGLRHGLVPATGRPLALTSGPRGAVQYCPARPRRARRSRPAAGPARGPFGPGNGSGVDTACPPAPVRTCGPAPAANRPFALTGGPRSDAGLRSLAEAGAPAARLGGARRGSGGRHRVPTHVPLTPADARGPGNEWAIERRRTVLTALSWRLPPDTAAWWWPGSEGRGPRPEPTPRLLTGAGRRRWAVGGGHGVRSGGGRAPRFRLRGRAGSTWDPSRAAGSVIDGASRRRGAEPIMEGSRLRAAWA